MLRCNPFPSGVAFDNFELIEPFQEGSEFWFGVMPGLWMESSTCSL